jgi:uncharacterized membrane protein
MWVIVLLIALLAVALVHGATGGQLAALLGALAGAVAVAIFRPRDVRMEARMRTLENAIEAGRARRGASHASAAASPEQAPYAVPPPEAAAETSAVAAPSAWSRFWVWLVEGNALARLGTVVLFVGVAFLLKYLYWLASASTGLRFAVVVLATIALLWIGWRRRDARPRYAQALQACGLGLLYIAAFASSNLLGLLPGWAAFVWLIAVVALAAILATAQNAQSLAMLAVAGGFLAPVLALPGGANHVALFAYYLVLDLAIIAIALRKSWHALNVLGLVFTFGVGSVWGARFYSHEYLGSTESFLILFFLLYLTVAAIPAWRETPSSGGYVDTAIVFGTPLMAFGLQAELFRGVEPVAAHRAMAVSALAVSAIYLLAALALGRVGRPGLRKLAKVFMTLGIIFASATVPLTLDGSWMSFAWALEGAALYWVGARQGRALPCVFGALLQVVAGVGLVADLQRGAIELPILNGVFLGCVALAAAALFCSRLDAQPRRTAADPSSRSTPGLFFWGLAWWITGGLHEIAVHAPDHDVLGAALLFLTATCAALGYLSGRGWPLARLPSSALLPTMAVILALQAFEHSSGHPLARLGGVAWPVAFLVHFGTLRGVQAGNGRSRLAHFAGFWLLAAAVTWEVAWAIGQIFPNPDPNSSPELAPAGLWPKVAWAIPLFLRELPAHPYWPYAAWALAPVILLAIVAAGRRTWLVARDPSAYLWTGPGPLVFFLILWTLIVNLIADGPPFPRLYVPLLNPLDVVQMLAFAVVVVWWRAVCASGIEDRREFPSTWPVTAWCVAIFFWANAVLFRTVHQIDDGGYRFRAALDSNQVQMAISLLWVSLALATMVVGRWVRNRQMWIVGSLLMVGVVVKLMAVELVRSIGGSISVESVIAGIAVGAVLLAAGWLVPVPPKYADE